MTEDDSSTLQSSGKMFRILEYLVRADGGGITEISDATEIPKSTVHLHLQSLLDLGYVVRGDQRYEPSLRLFELGEQTRRNNEVYRKGRREVDLLAEKTNALVNLGVLEGGKARLLYLRELKGDQSKSSASVSSEFEASRPSVSLLSENYDHVPGKTLDMHATALGKSILAQLPQEKVDEIVDRHGLDNHTPNTITSRDHLFSELENVRSRGYAEDVEGRVEELCCVAASICWGDEPVGAVSVSCLSDRWNGEFRERLSNEVMNTAHMIEIKLTHS